MAEKLTLYNESIRNGEKARWPYDTSLPLSERYNTVMNSVKQAKNGYLFEGWRYNGTIYKEPFQNEETNPFGPINEDIEIMAMWSKIIVYCVLIPNETVPYEGGPVTVTYYAVVGNQIINSNEVTLIVDTDATDASYTRGSDGISGNFRACNFTFNQNVSHDGKYLTVYAQYRDIKSELLIIYQTNPYEVVIPDSDYFLFNYNWLGSDGIDLDSLTVIRVVDENGQIKHTSFSGNPVGYRTSTEYEHEGYTYNVYSSNHLLCLRHSEDNRDSGAEGAVICLTNIANTGEISALDKIYIDIYANWYGEIYNGNMEIVCKGYKHKSNQTPANYNEDIIEEPHTSNSRTYYTFLPNTDNCKVSWNPGSGQALSIKAYGYTNACWENAFIPYLGNLYSHVATVSYNIGTNIKTLNIRTADNGINNEQHLLELMANGTVHPTAYSNEVCRLDLPNEGQTNVVIDNIYFRYYSTEGHELATWDKDICMLTNDEDEIKVKYYYSDQADNFTIKRENLGTTYYSTAGGATPVSYINNLVITQDENTDKLKIKFDITNANGNRRNVDFVFLKISGDGYHPVRNEVKISIYQNGPS